MNLLILQGPEFLDSSGAEKIFLGLGYQTELTHLRDPFFSQKWKTADFVFCRAAFCASSEDKVLAWFCAKKIQLLLKEDWPTLGKKKFLGIGRAFLIGLYLYEEAFVPQLTWKACPFQEIWIPSHFHEENHFKFLSFYSAKACPNSDLWPADWRPWLWSNAEILGWQKNQKIFLSPADPFALSKRSQLRHYGYNDLSFEKTNLDLFEYIFRNSSP